ncbi:MAG: UDP-N-acetylmuramoyl-L-alanine--D-glutamate ligase [Deltaproteobacteria bacterium]|nr:UDP-N-acetylmuramoyl-L-alanine--D-glutamate ligase [Deltaproteobacteria bacterium]MBW2448492.1 UDP-N-acetylmuramoyl-L-alanine--D-glutamate ligase [Deltaproteobacteria bacterium]
METLANQRVLVLGLGVSGRSAAAFCSERGARVTAADERSADALGPLDLPASVATVVGVELPDPASFDLVVPSPGVPPSRYAGRARRVWGDVELAARNLAVPIVAVTGTNGKSTTVLLIEAMLRAAGLRAEAAGNVGRPALELVGRPLDVAVLEVSSFQLEAVDAFRPRVAVVLNLAPDHLDRHGDLAAYRDAKARIFANQEPDDVAVLNGADPAVDTLASRTRARVLRFHRDAPPAEPGAGCAWFDSGAICLRLGDELSRVPLDGLSLPGLHNVENVMAALLAVSALGADPARAARALPDFEALPHRAEAIASREGVDWIDDSKATNPHAAGRALEGCDRPVVWIAGGRDKGLDYDSLAEVACDRVREAILIGEAAPKLAQALDRRVPCSDAGSLAEAVARAAHVARDGDVVLLAPACASQDQFENFEDRGRAFREAVAQLDAEEASQ